LVAFDSVDTRFSPIYWYCKSYCNCSATAKGEGDIL